MALSIPAVVQEGIHHKTPQALLGIISHDDAATACVAIIFCALVL